jgi:hypothetical protein
MTGPFQQKLNCQLNGWIIINYQNLSHENLSTSAESGPTTSCKGLAQFANRCKRSRGGFLPF